MPIVKRPTTHTRKRVLERQAPGAPMGLIALAFVSALPMLFFFGYNYWRYKSLDQIEIFHQAQGAVPPHRFIQLAVDQQALISIGALHPTTAHPHGQLQ